MTSNANPEQTTNRREYSELDAITNRLQEITVRERNLLDDFMKTFDDFITKTANTNAKINQILDRQPAQLTTAQAQITCTVCHDKQRDCVLEPCMHVCCCISCLQMIPDNRCPICRSPVDYYLKLYIS